VQPGIALVDKPLGVSSHTVVSWARKALNTKKVGHAGTLDPAASGLLVLGVGTGTRLLTFCVGMDKTYEATLRLGYATTTDDAEGERIEVSGGSLDQCTPEALDAVISHFTGVISQIPSTYSAIKVQGRRSYDLARLGQDVELTARPVTVSKLERGALTRGEGYIEVGLVIECSSGTYIRALARDIGRELGVGGHLVALRRSVVGPFSLAGAVPADQIDASVVMSLADAAAAIMPVVKVGPIDLDSVLHGRSISALDWPKDQPVGVLDEEGRHLLGVAQAHHGRSRILMGVPPSEVLGKDQA